jgi:hypothetical protein
MIAEVRENGLVEGQVCLSQQVDILLVILVADVFDVCTLFNWP